MATRLRRATAAAGAVLLAAALAACGSSGATDDAGRVPVGTITTMTSEPTVEPSVSDTATDDPSDDGHSHSGGATKPKPLRAGEKRMTLQMPAAYTPSPPTGTGTDDYRCFLLDPHLTDDVYLTGTFVKPGNPDVVHHVILFTVPPDQVAEAEQMDANQDGEGWTCFGGSGLRDNDGLNSAPWLGAWAPGGKESVSAAGFGKLLTAGSRIIMQVHYNLLAGPGPDESAAVLRYAPGSAELTPLETVLLPAPVEMPCRPQYSDGPLCDRQASIDDLIDRVGGAGNTNNALYFLCGGKPKPSNVTSCDRTISEPTTIRAVAGHMHLLGRSIKIEVNPGKPDAQTILNIPIWDFDNQGAQPIKPVSLDYGDVVRVTCKHVQWLRDKLPAFEGIPDKYVVWGEGTTDEMCLGILTVTRP
ncbi:hypothetical protein [Nocardioides agariphilus]|jgi:hypothetical protein|uniref:hypothetical protein n=1 Tax=Nocardioides agariphilus TaxID=433664 RepID=UPI001E4DB526|nr:hypothetical protein [Nocardioides agariphilus]